MKRALGSIVVAACLAVAASGGAEEAKRLPRLDNPRTGLENSPQGGHP